MIVGIGVDVLEVCRMQDVLERHGSRFLDHVFTDQEQCDAPTGAGRPAYFAGRWAAKEAVAKALGTGIGTHCAWTDIRVVRDEWGRPAIALSGAAAATARRFGIDRIHVTISHERRLACASAVAERDRHA